MAPLDVEVLEYQCENFPFDPFSLSKLVHCLRSENWLLLRLMDDVEGQVQRARMILLSGILVLVIFNMSMDFGAVDSGLPQPGLPEEHISPKKNQCQSRPYSTSCHLSAMQLPCSHVLGNDASPATLNRSWCCISNCSCCHKHGVDDPQMRAIQPLFNRPCEATIRCVSEHDVTGYASTHHREQLQKAA